MNIKLIVVGKTDDANLIDLIAQYTKRLSHYVNFSIEILPDIKQTKNLSESEQKAKEGAQILAKITAGDMLILLDENGKQFTSVDFAAELQKKNEQRHQAIGVCHWWSFWILR
jgi:23S rRNA (pseudouridine1915-N3)-methyltransferase